MQSNGYWCLSLVKQHHEHGFILRHWATLFIHNLQRWISCEIGAQVLKTVSFQISTKLTCTIAICQLFLFFFYNFRSQYVLTLQIIFCFFHFLSFHEFWKFLMTFCQPGICPTQYQLPNATMVPEISNRILHLLCKWIKNY